jgi:hypothetical protein
MSDLVVVARFSYRHAGEFARGFLEGAGIPSHLAVDDAGGYVTFSNVATLMVRSEDAEEAREVLRAADIEVE